MRTSCATPDIDASLMRSEQIWPNGLRFLWTGAFGRPGARPGVTLPRGCRGFLIPTNLP